MRLNIKSVLVVICALLLGAYLNETDRFKFYKVVDVKRFISKNLFFYENQLQESRYDSVGRLVYSEGKTLVPCPEQTDRTFVLLTVGQSNAGNSQGQKHRTKFGRRVINYIDGQCFLAESPLLGASGSSGESWTYLGNELVRLGIADQVIIIPFAVGGTPIRRWAVSGDLGSRLIASIRGIKDYKVTHLLWHQGESDFLESTSYEFYFGVLEELMMSIYSQNPTLKIYVSVATYCKGSERAIENPISKAQVDFISLHPKFYQGPNTDKLVDQFDRFDDCHFSYSGQKKFVEDWLRILK